MAAFQHGLVVVFYVAMFAALLYFVHKVAWFVRLRRLQERLVAEAERRVRDATSEAASRWEQSAHSTWSNAADEVEEVDDEDPVAYARRTERRLAAMDRALAAGGDRATPWFEDRVREGDAETAAITVLTMPSVIDDNRHIPLEVSFAPTRRPPPPPVELYELEVRSRYGFWRRALAFVLGAADVVYSSSHVARMSQDAQVPTSVILRRLSLVAVILGAIVIDIAFSLRARLIDAVGSWLGPPPHGLGPLDEHLATGIALGGWLAVYGAIYFGLFLFLRRRSQVYLRRLAQMKEHRERDVDAIVGHHLDELYRWAGEYARTLDGAVEIAQRQGRLLVGRSMRRLRRRLASDELVRLGERVAGALFARLPEASVGLQDVATEQRHSWRHAIWPRVDELGYQVELARTRAAWRRVVQGLAELRGDRFDPTLADALWRNLAVIARMFPEDVDEAFVEELEEAYAQSIRGVVDGTEADLAELDARLGELGDGLREQLAVAGSLLETQIELTEQAMDAEVAELATKLLEVREGARVEAMAFEI